MTDRASLRNDLEDCLRLMMDGRQATLWTAVPAVVISVNWSQMTVAVQPTIQGKIQSYSGAETFVNLPVLLDCPITFPSAGGFTITLPIQIGDEVLVILASRCIDAWWQNGGIQVPMEARMHDLSDGFVIPGPKSLPNTIAGISTTGAQMRNNAGTTYIELSADGKIKIVSPVEIDVTGNLHVAGTIVATGEITGNAIPLSTHIHSGVTTGSGDSGPPL